MGAPARPASGVGLNKLLWRRIGLGTAGIVLTLVAWQWYSTLSPYNVFVASSPLRTWTTLSGMLADGDFWSKHVSASARGLATGWGVAVLAGTAIGAVMGFSRGVRETLEPLLFAVNSVPRLALIPVLTLWLGYGQVYKTVVVVIAGLFPVLLNTMDGVRRADSQLMRMSRSFGASRLQQLTTVALPGCVPTLFAGLRQSLAHSVVGVVGAEIWASAAGLGWLIANGELTVRTDAIIATVLVITAAGIALNEMLQRIEAQLTRWQRGRT